MIVSPAFSRLSCRVAQTDGVLPAHLNADRAARYLYAVVEGLRWPTLIGAYTSAQALAVLDDHLA